MTPALSDDRLTDGRARLRRALTRLGLVAAAWAAILEATSGVVFTLGPIHISSRNARNPAIGALVLLAIAFLCAPAGARTEALLGDLTAGRPGRALMFLWRSLLRLLRAAARPEVTTVLAGVLVVLTLVISWTHGAYVAGGSDSYGYVSEGHLFATGRLGSDVPLANAFPHVPLRAMTPLGYRPAEDGSNTVVPTYAPGLPLTMALAERIAGMSAVYAVMPLLAAVAVWFTFRLGVQLAGPGTGLGAALLVAFSPAFVLQLIGAPMSDIPATGWWTLALSLLLHDRRWTSVAAGVAAGLALLTRPNLLLVVVVLGSYLLWKVVRGTSGGPTVEAGREPAVEAGREPAVEADLQVGLPKRTDALIHLALFSLPVVVACLTVAAFNAAWYGSPLRSGYPADLFNLHYWRNNIANYPRWLAESQTPLLLVGLAAPFVVQWSGRPYADRRPAAWLLAGAALTVFASYLFYSPFDAWWYLRFLLPAYPALAVATCLTLTAFAARFGQPARLLGVAAVGGAVAFSYHYEKDFNVMGEYRYQVIAEWARDNLPERSVLVAMQHSGSLRHYSGRGIVRYDNVAKGDFESALDEIIDKGYRPYVIVDEWEVSRVRQQHGAGRRGALDWPPIAMLPLANVTVWDLAEDRDAARASGRTPVMIPIPEAIRRRLP